MHGGAVLGADVPAGEGPVVEHEAHRRSTRPAPRWTLAKAFSSLGRAGHLGARRRGDVELHDLAAGPVAGVGDRHLDDERARRGRATSADDVGVAERERRVREAVAEREPHRQVAGSRTSGTRRTRPRRSGGSPWSPGKLPNDGLCSSRTGIVVGSRPPGSASPVSTSASAGAISWPPNHTWSTAATSSTQAWSTGAPALTTTTVRGLAAATARISVVLLAGQVHRPAVEALGLPLVVGADDDDGDVGVGRGGHGPLDGVGRRGGAGRRP